MPELPEVEHIRRSLEPMLVGAHVTNVKLRRRDVVRQRGRIGPRHLLKGATIEALVRHGKDLALTSRDGRTLGVHLGMSGWLTWMPGDPRKTHGESSLDHVHCVWTINGPGGQGVMRFRDPRRFGGLWTFPSLEDWRHDKLADRGPDALAIEPETLAQALAGSRRAIKAALLDQAVLAGVGNIYADEALFAAGIHPATMAARLARCEDRVASLCTHLRSILARAIRAGGSTVRSYRGVNGEPGDFAPLHQVYGRAGTPCVRCAHTLRAIQLAQRTTVFCPQCQRRTFRVSRQPLSTGSLLDEGEINLSSSS